MNRPAPRREAIGASWLMLLVSFGCAASNSCIDCHQDEAFYATQPKLYRYYQDWLLSPHHQQGVTCDDCHGGNPAAAGVAEAHAGIFPVADARSLLNVRNQPATCGACHDDKQQEFQHSKHYRALQGESATAPTCTTCHPAMNKRPSYQLIVLNACDNCHKPGNRQGLPLVVDQAESVFRHLNMAEGLLGWVGLHYESHQWPGDSRERLRELRGRYETIVSQVHRFDLEQTGNATTTLLQDLRQLFDEARQATREQREGAAEAAPTGDAPQR